MAAAAAAAAAAAKYTGKFALHPLLPGAAQAAADACKGKISPLWAPKAMDLLSKWEKLSVCMPRYADFRAKTKSRDVKKLHVFMNEEAQARLGEFYLCCALRLREQAVDECGKDAEKLMQLANAVATEEVEPFFKDCQEFVKDYDEALHRRLDGTTVWREVDDSLFWHHSFEAACPDVYAAFREAALPPEDKWPARDDAAGVQAVLEDCIRAVDEGGKARPLAEDTYGRFLAASASPVKASIRAALIDHGIVWGMEVTYRGLDMQAGTEE
eukprot:gnl/TRDRNA2_/TRDRNA2_186392_c0_seq1.p1 gnl/TRDRNA2_/TRDRNA2_186392_c0~~gnl/TRDRNA2_/TRDRNA2_186392_c0_seq1.p1  ORF type:complete len:283 (+),score=74.52 gnl/TRDRNA2_/TRDRNA2_186392_c0_seq1:42-851(+)